jgi:hypothetical protein
MTSCSLAISDHADKLHCFLVLALEDELRAQPPEEPAQLSSLEDMAVMNADYAMHKIKSLSNHRDVIELHRDQREARAEEELDDANESQWTMIGNTRIPQQMLELQVAKPDMPEEFNKKVFDLIDIALKDARKRQMPAMWCPWF